MVRASRIIVRHVWDRRSPIFGDLRTPWSDRLRVDEIDMVQMRQLRSVSGRWRKEPDR
jgi:hypothetical protein